MIVEYSLLILNAIFFPSSNYYELFLLLLYDCSIHENKVFLFTEFLKFFL